MIKIRFKVPKQPTIYWAYFLGSSLGSISIPFFVDTRDNMQQFVGILLWFFVLMAGLTGMHKHDSRRKEK